MKVVAYMQRYKIESNSQPSGKSDIKSSVVAYMQRYKIESNSQHTIIDAKINDCCCLYAKIQNWKQFTTVATITKLEA